MDGGKSSTANFQYCLGVKDRPCIAEVYYDQVIMTNSHDQAYERVTSGRDYPNNDKNLLKRKKGHEVWHYTTKIDHETCDNSSLFLFLR